MKDGPKKLRPAFYTSKPSEVRAAASLLEAKDGGACASGSLMERPQRTRVRRNYGQIRAFDVANGEGIRTSIFVTGCTHKCPDCFNGDYQDFHAGEPWTDAATHKVINYLKSPNVAGLTLLGGEPMQNLWLTDVVREIKTKVSKSIWVYSGYTYEQILAHRGRRELLEECDILVDGLFVADLKDLRLKFRGSSNQRIINIRESLISGHIVEYHPK